jgi:hypothetical protein
VPVELGPFLDGRVEVFLGGASSLAGIVGILCLPVAAMLISPSLAATPPWERAKKAILLAANLT